MKSKILICSVTGAAYQWGGARWVQVAKPKNAVAGETVSFDQHPHLLNCQNGVVDLRTGKLRAHDSNLLLTQICPINYHPKAKAVAFGRFIARAMGQVSPRGRISPEVRARLDYLQRAIGYAFTGETCERSAFVVNGVGNTGKTTFSDALAGVLGPDYSGSVCLPFDRFNADLHRARIVFTDEVAGSCLKEETLKLATFDGMIRTSRRYAPAAIEFQVTHKLLIDCNYLPVLRGSNNAIWRRLKVIPFVNPVRIGSEDRDLSALFAASRGGILAWAVRGAVAYYRNGLGEWPEVKSVAPCRVKRERRTGWKMPPNTVSVTRPGKWGNPFRVGDGSCSHPDCGPKSHPPTTPQMAVDAFRRWITPEYEENARRELRGKNLACFCALDQPCHADVLLGIANA